MKLTKIQPANLIILILAVTLAACNPAATQTPLIEAIETVGLPPTEAPLSTNTPLPLPSDTPMPTFSPQEYEASGLGGILWQWMRLDFVNNTTLLVDDASKYTLQFLADGTMNGTPIATISLAAIWCKAARYRCSSSDDPAACPPIAQNISNARDSAPSIDGVTWC
jgi:hypothetical protein